MLLLESCLLFCIFFSCNTLQSVDTHSTSYVVFNVFCYLVYFFASQSIPGFVTLQDLTLPKNNATSKPQEICSVSFEVEIIKKSPSQSGIKEKILEPPANFERSHQVVNTNRSDNEEEKENTDNHIEISNMEDVKIVEIRYCTICKIDQPMRTKHCRYCGRCVATQDHHCPWLGVCIGERNKKLFYFYLLVQLAQIVWALGLDLWSVNSPGGVLSWFLENWLRLILAFSLGFFLIMVGGLIVFHLYLASVNLTTWEFLSWNKISYLKGLNRDLGSPFSDGVLNNLYSNCCRRIPKYFIVWEINRSK